MLKISSKLSADTNNGIPCADNGHEPAVVAARYTSWRCVMTESPWYRADNASARQCVQEVHTQGRGCPSTVSESEHHRYVAAAVLNSTLLLQCFHFMDL